MVLKSLYQKLCNVPADAKAVWFQSRGYKFEKLLFALLHADALDPRTSYKTAGEQIDGSFFLDGTIFLLEAKWHKDEVPASTLYQFKGKVDGKLVGTLGVFISMSGYSRDAVDALTLGKSLNLILFDKQDIDAAIKKGLGFKNILKNKLRKAAEEGIVYYPTEIEVVTKDSSSLIEIESLAFGHITEDNVSRQQPTTGPDIVVICEGQSDREIISLFARKILQENSSPKAINIAVTEGKLTIPKVANAIHDIAHDGTKFLIVADSDNDVSGTREFLSKNLSFPDWTLSIPNPGIETWLGSDRHTIKRVPRKDRLSRITEQIDKIDIDELRSCDSEFNVFYTALVET